MVRALPRSAALSELVKTPRQTVRRILYLPLLSIIHRQQIVPSAMELVTSKQQIAPVLRRVPRLSAVMSEHVTI